MLLDTADTNRTGPVAHGGLCADSEVTCRFGRLRKVRQNKRPGLAAAASCC